MNRKFGMSSSNGNESYFSKRIRGEANHESSITRISSRQKDQIEKSESNEAGYKHLSNDISEEVSNMNSFLESSSHHNDSNPGKEQQMCLGVCSSNYESRKYTTTKEEKYSSGTLPTPYGWTTCSGNERTVKNNYITESGKHCCNPTYATKSNGFMLSSIHSEERNTHNPYSNNKSIFRRKKYRTSLPSVTRTFGASSSEYDTPRSLNRKRNSNGSTQHIVCAVSENLARETCVAYLNAGYPTYLHIIKQGNGQTYSETLSLLRILRPDEVLLNEGRKHSQLASKVMNLFGSHAENEEANKNGFASQVRKKRSSKKFPTEVNKFNERFNAGEREDATTATKISSSECRAATVVKFIPRSYFDQTKGADILRKLAREDTYDASLVEEYILLSSSHAVLQYAQLCLGATLTKSSLTLNLNVGGNNRMYIDRATMVNLELLVNAKTGRTNDSLVGTIDCTKTSVGGRLLRTNFLAPPTRLDTINARLDLVDAFLQDEEFFYIVMEHLEDLPDIEKMLSYVTLVPSKHWAKNGNNKALFGNKEVQKVTKRIASRGISALVCIKSTLNLIQSFAHVLEVQLKEIGERESRSTIRHDESRENSKTCQKSKNHDEQSTTIDRSGNHDSTESDSLGEPDSSTMTQDSSLQIGLGMGNDRSSLVRHSRHQLLQAILITMKQPALLRVLNAVTNIFTESTAYIKNSHAMRHQECFALKPNTDGMMDIFRKAFLANVDDIYRLADEYAETYDIRVQVKESTSRGYYLSIPADLGLNLPQIFIQPVKLGKFIHCTTEEVYSLNSRAQENVQDLLLMTHERIQEVLGVARENFDCLASLSDAIALLDMCHSFADNVASSRKPWCRPVLSDRDRKLNEEDGPFGGGGAIAIRNGRYSIDVTSGMNSSSSEEFVPNDTYCSSLQNFTVITGINGSGKSTYLKQIALIVILAHCGSYVPADEAFIPIRDQICTRIGTSDDQEHNISTFLMEMKETAAICNSMTEKSLFLLDELGRATSNEDGFALAWSVSEYLLMKRAMTFFVTHYPQICKLADIYSNVQNQHLGARTSSICSENGVNISYTHKIMPGPCTAAEDYGVEATVLCGWPVDVVENARNIRLVVQSKMPGNDLCENKNAGCHKDTLADRKRNAHNILCDLAKHIVAMKEGEGRLSNVAKRSFLQELRDRLIPTEDRAVIKNIRNLLLNCKEDLPMISLTSSTCQNTASKITDVQLNDDAEMAASREMAPMLERMNEIFYNNDAGTSSVLSSLIDSRNAIVGDCELKQNDCALPELTQNSNENFFPRRRKNCGSNMQNASAHLFMKNFTVTPIIDASHSFINRPRSESDVSDVSSNSSLTEGSISKSSCCSFRKDDMDSSKLSCSSSSSFDDSMKG